MQQERTVAYQTEIGGAGRQVQFSVYVDPDSSPWGVGHGDLIVASMLRGIRGLDCIGRAWRGHVTRGTLHLYANLTEGADRSAAVDEINRIVARFF